MSINDPAIAQFFDADEAPWNYMMATAILYTLPPVASFFALRTHPRVPRRPCGRPSSATRPWQSPRNGSLRPS
jgi:hypothetical protein